MTNKINFGYIIDMICNATFVLPKPQNKLIKP